MAAIAPTDVAQDVTAMITLESDVFADGEVIPRRYTCDASNMNPPLKWRGVPDETSQLVVVLEDPDAGDETLVHWMVAELDPNLGELPENWVPETAQVGLNDLGHVDYRGPCPPQGEEHHRYVFTLLAVREPLDLEPRFTPDQLVKQLEGNVLGKGELIGRYGRSTLAGPNPAGTSG